MPCYNPDGQENTGLTPCNPDAPDSPCCREGDVCLSSGYCFSAGLGTLVRRGCTDKTFKNAVCPSDCRTGANLNFADVLITPCDGIYTFCCGNDKVGRDCCNAGNGTFRIDAGSAVLPTASVISTATITSTTTISGATVSVTGVSSDYEAQRTISIGVGAGLGAGFAIAAALFLFTGWKLRIANRRIQAQDQQIRDMINGASLSNIGN